MGLLQQGKWVDLWYDTKSSGGRFQRQDSSFRNWVTVDGAGGPSGGGGFKADFGRYHLYVSLACPWAHRTLILRALKGLNDGISVSTVHWYMAENGWTFEADNEAPTSVQMQSSDPCKVKFLHEIYTYAHPSYSGRVTVPVLWDKQNKTIVSNESSEIIRMFNSAFNECGANEEDYYPKECRTEIDALNSRIYNDVNNGVYRAGFSTSQHVYEEAVCDVFKTLNWLEKLLGKQRYLVGGRITEADWRLFTTLIRFDAVYVGHFKCNVKRITDFPNLSEYLRDLYQYPGIAETVNMVHIKNHYYGSHKTINPSGVVPSGPNLNFLEPHNRHLLDDKKMLTRLNSMMKEPDYQANLRA